MNAGIILIVAFISAGLGYLAGLFLTQRSAGNDTDQKDKEASATPRYEAHRLDVSLWSKTPQGPLSANLFGHTFANREDVSEPEKNRLVQDIRSIEAWFGISTAKSIIVNGTTLTGGLPSKTIVEPVIISPTDEIVPAVTDTEIPPIVPAVEPVLLEPPTPEIHISEAQLDEIAPPPPVAPVAARLDNRAKTKNPEPKSIVEQINDILQEKVAVSNQPNTTVKLQETPQGALVWVGAQSYQGIDTVPDGFAKDLIRAAVKEWEKR